VERDLRCLGRACVRKDIRFGPLLGGCGISATPEM